METLPHTYDVDVNAAAEGGISTQCAGAPGLTVNAPAQFGGPGDAWSPETLFLAAVANCFVLTFRAVSQASRLEWKNLDCRAVGVLDKQDGKMRFTEVQLTEEFALAEREEEDKALRMIQKAEENCLVSNSLAVPVVLQATVNR